MKRCEKLPLWSLVALAVVSAATPLAAAAQTTPPAPPQSQDQKVSPEAARQIADLAREKRARTAAQKKIDTQLLYALKQKRGERRGVPSEPVDIKLDAHGRALVDITARVSAKLISKLGKLGAEVVSQSAKYHTVRVKVTLEKLEALAAIEEVRYISPAAQAMTHGGARTN
ncbi:MAG TPA: hypothetical protein VF064_19250 [Pyrinomonadaceae bacterium]